MNKPKHNRRKYIMKPRVSKKLIMAAAASVMAVTVAASLLWHALKVSVPAEAQHALSGVYEAIKDHGSGESFVILDIVPGSTGDDLSLGTIGYLTSGQSPLEQSLAKIFKADADDGYKYYTDRERKAEKLANIANAAAYYKESLTGGGSWTKLFDGIPYTGEKFDEDIVAHSSVVKGTYERLEGGAYRLAEDIKVITYKLVAAADAYFTKINGEAAEGYLPDGEPELVHPDGGYADDTDVYYLEDGVYIYFGKVSEINWEDEDEGENEGEFIEIPGEEPTEEEPVDGENPEEGADGGEGSEEKPEPITPVDPANGEPAQPGDPANGEPAQPGDPANGEPVPPAVTEENPVQEETDAIQQEEPAESSQTTDAEPSASQSQSDESSEASAVTEVGKTAYTSYDDNDNYVASLVWKRFVETTSDEPTADAQGSSMENSAAPGGSGTDGSGTQSGSGTGNPDNQDGSSTDNSGNQDAGGTEGTGSPADPANPDGEGRNDDSEISPAPANPVHQGGSGPKDDSEPKEYYILTFKPYDGGEPREDLYEPSRKVSIEVTESDGLTENDELAEDDGERQQLELEGREDLPRLVYVGEGKGDYTIIRTERDEELMVYNAPVYFRCFDEDLLKEYVFCNSALNIKIDVKSAADVTLEDVKNADLIYLEDIPDRGNISYISNNNDMGTSVVFSIIDRAVNDLLPVIVDYHVSVGGVSGDIDGNGGNAEGMYLDTNYQKLADILLKTDLYSFFQDMEDVTNMLMNSGSDGYGNKSDNNYNYVNCNIYVANPAEAAAPSWKLSDRDDFAEPFGDVSGFEEVQAAINMENRQYSNDNDKIGPLSKATAIQYIINYANGFIGEFRDFTILELQPTSGDSDLNTRNDSRNNTILYWKRPGAAGSGQQLIRSRKLITIAVDTESVAQFSGEQGDINGKYQMVFIGLDGQRLNFNGKDTVYNDSSLNGKVYSSVGDVADGGGQRYEGIDITPQKKEALLGFMRAGYPIVVENDFFVGKSAKEAGVGDINTKYIDESSQMYDFLKTALSEDRDCFYTISDIRSYSADFAAQINVRRPGIIYDEGNPTGAINPTGVSQSRIIQTVRADAEGKYRGYIPYKVMDDTLSSYNNSVNTRFYLDMNHDGRFDALEEVTGDGIIIGNGLLFVEFAAPERGSIPWKLEISDTGNSYRRDALTGYFEIKKPTQIPIRVVQVVGGNAADSFDAGFNFEAAYEMSDRALLGYYLKNAEAMIDAKLEIETMTAGQLAEELKLNGEYLSGADVLVLGFGPECSLNVPVVDRNVEWYVNKYVSEGRGVLLSSAASSEAAGRLQLPPSVLGLKDVKTYNSLGKSPSGLYKYSTLKPAMFGEWNMLDAVKVNDGAVSHYPYEVGGNITLGSSVGIADYTLDLAANGASDMSSDVTAWYCLGDSALFGEKTSYGVSTKDAANNYYIYSKGNVVYVGENGYPYAYDNTVSAVPSESTQGTDNCRLLVNALMEAYSVGIKNPKVTIVAGLADDSSEADSICIPYDEQIKEIEIELNTDDGERTHGVLDDGSNVDVYFKITEPNLAFRKDVTFAFYYEDDLYGTPIDVGGRIVNATPFTSEMWTVEQNNLVQVTMATGLDLVPGKVYKIKAPVKPLKDNDNSVNADIYIVVQSHFIKLGQDRHPVGSDSVTLNRAQLFLLE